MDAWGKLAYDEMFVGIFGMSLLGVILYEAVNTLERWCCEWKYVTTKSAFQADSLADKRRPLWLSHFHTYGKLIKFSHTVFA